MVEPGETPSEACAREVQEELGLTVTVGPALVVDWAPHPAQGDKLLFVFDAAPLTEADQATIHFADGEITAWEYVATAALDDYVVPRLARRLRAAVPGKTRYLEHGNLLH